MSFSYIANAKGNNDSSGTTLDASSTLNIASGDLIVSVVFWNDGTSNPSVADSGGSENDHTMLDTYDQSGQVYMAIGYKISATANSSSTMRFSLSTAREYRSFIAFQFRPDSGETVTFDAGPGSAGGSGTSFVSDTISTTGTDEVVIGAGGIYYGLEGTDHLIGGETPALVVDGVSWVEAYYEFFSSTQTDITASQTQSASGGPWVEMIAAFKSESSDLSIDIGADEAAYQGKGVRILTP
jgi:hypothetical protein